MKDRAEDDKEGGRLEEEEEEEKKKCGATVVLSTVIHGTESCYFPRLRSGQACGMYYEIVLPQKEAVVGPTGKHCEFPQRTEIYILATTT
jgi:hypothetical protein